MKLVKAISRTLRWPFFRNLRSIFILPMKRPFKPNILILISCLISMFHSTGWASDKTSTDTLIIKTHEIREVLVRDKQKKVQSVFTGKEIVTKKDIENVPMLLGEADVLRAVRLLPGVQSVSEGNSGVYVRGGSAGQNLFLLDDMELLNPSHLMGIFSVFNPLTTNRVDVFKGNAPVNLQGRLASTIDVQSIKPDSLHTGLEVNLGNISSSLGLSFRSKNGKFDMILGGRTTFLEVLGHAASLFIADSINYFKGNKYGFYDFNGKINLWLSTKTQLTWAWYTGQDHFSINNAKLQYLAATSWGNNSSLLQVKHKPDELKTLTTSLAYQSTSSGFEGELLSNQLYFTSFFEQIQQKNKWEQRWDNQLTHLGLEFFGQHAIPVRMAMSYLTDTVRQDHSFRNIGFSAYLGNHYFSTSEKIQVYAGVRSTWLTPIGPYQYGSQSFEKNDRIKTWITLSPTLALSFYPTEKESFKLSASINHQDLHLASLSSIPLPNDLWTLSSPRLRPETSNLVSVGYYKNLGPFDLSVEAYGKRMYHQLIFNVITDNSSSQGFEDQFFKGSGLAYGIDLSIEKKTGLFTGSLGYSYSRSKRSFPSILEGTWFNDKNDRPHDLNLSVCYKWNPSWDFSTLWVFASGNNMTLPSGRCWMLGQIMNDYDNFNGFRFPSYHRLDVAANWHLKSRIFKESVLNFSIINLYNRSNPYFAYYKVYMGENRYNLDVRSYQVSLFPIMPSISWRFKI